ncbi:MAG: cytochrome c, partial [Xanthobacteraceae bacterium]
DRVDPHDRWAIAAYIRALQLSRRATMAEVPDAAGHVR